MRFLLEAGAETTYRSSSNLLYGLLSQPDVLEEVRTNRELLPQAMEEALRWEPPLTGIFRGAARDTELAGVHIPKGSVLSVNVGAANRDETRWEHPEVFDIHRAADRAHRLRIRTAHLSRHAPCPSRDDHGHERGAGSSPESSSGSRRRGHSNHREHVPHPPFAARALRRPLSEENRDVSFDYIVVGGGSAGCVVASRLSEQRAEPRPAAGSRSPRPEPDALHTGRRVGDGRQALELRRRARSIAQWSDDAVDGRQGPRRRQLGQRHGVGAGQPSRLRRVGQPRMRRLGLRERAPVLQARRALRRRRRSLPRKARGRSACRSKGSPISSTTRSAKPPRRPDTRSTLTTTASPSSVSARARLPSGAAFARAKRGSYLGSAWRRPNLTTRTGCEVQRILFEGNRAVGVEYVRKGKRVVEHADREVIISAGALSSPKLLMLSGVGPRDDIERVRDHVRVRSVRGWEQTCKSTPCAR